LRSGKTGVHLQPKFSSPSPSKNWVVFGEGELAAGDWPSVQALAFPHCNITFAAWTILAESFGRGEDFSAIPYPVFRSMALPKSIAFF
jgi:hypothetical protein